MEEWREIPGTDYSVSSEGRVASRKKGGWRMMKGGRDRDGYPQVGFCDGRGRYRTAPVHKLVAETFLGPGPTPKHEVNHKNGVKADNRLENLEWVTKSENSRHRHYVLKHGNFVLRGLRGEANGKAKLTEANVHEIIRRCAAGEVHGVVGADYGISRVTVSQIAAGKRWAWLTQAPIHANL